MKNQHGLTAPVAVSVAFILYSANEIFFLNFKLFNLQSLAMACIVLLQFARVFPAELTAGRTYALLALVFLSGINIGTRPKAFLFMALLFLAIAIYRGYFHGERFWKEMLPLAVASAVSFVLALALFILTVFGTGALWLVFVLTIALLAIQLYDLRVSRSLHESAPGGGDS
ncbi:MAG TPA: hypothetical protein VLM75_09855 [Spirochaetota bacterium]|nr:hypothetical protein [Spirochaetota bacterium]